MAYDVNLVQINTNGGGFSTGGTGTQGFPASGVNFSTLLYSQWVCGSNVVLSGFSGWPSMDPVFSSGATWFSFGIGIPINLASYAHGAFFTGSFPIAATAGVRTHMMCSVDTQTNSIQVYLNDAPATVTGTWTGAVGANWFNLTTSNGFAFNVSGVVASGNYPGVGDIWCAHTPGFVDLSIIANRRKFINSDLTPVDLGTDGSSAFGYQPQMYFTMRPGGVPGDILINRGTGGGTYGHAQNPPTLQMPGTCSLPAGPPPPLPPASGLQMEQMFASFPVEEECKVFLIWSDDRGHSFGNPVGQSLGGDGEYIKSLQWQRLGVARDRVFQIEWSCAKPTALQGAWVEVTPAQS